MRPCVGHKKASAPTKGDEDMLRGTTPLGKNFPLVYALTGAPGTDYSLVSEDFPGAASRASSAHCCSLAPTGCSLGWAAPTTPGYGFSFALNYTIDDFATRVVTDDQIGVSQQRNTSIVTSSGGTPTDPSNAMQRSTIAKALCAPISCRASVS
jgi:hypothetical protein